MKKTSLFAFILLALIFPLFASGNQERETEQTSNASMPNIEGDRNILIVYFSWAENNDGAFGVDVMSTSSVQSPGNVEELASFVSAYLDADVFSIKVKDPYPATWDECLARANNERRENARPEIVENISNLADYDTIFLGYPNWWYGIPMALFTFFESNDLRGKDLYLFCSHGTGGLARSVDLIRAELGDSNISDNVFHVNEHRASLAEPDVIAWLRDLGF